MHGRGTGDHPANLPRIMHLARVLLPCLTLLAALTAAASGWAQTGSGGARPTPVVPGEGGGGVADVEDPGSPGTPASDPLPQTIPSPAPAPTHPDPPLTIPQVDDEVLLGLEPEDDSSDAPGPTGGGASVENTDSEGGAFGLLASTGFEIAGLVRAGTELLLVRVGIRSGI